MYIIYIWRIWDIYRMYSSTRREDHTGHPGLYRPALSTIFHASLVEFFERNDIVDQYLRSRDLEPRHSTFQPHVNAIEHRSVIHASACMCVCVCICHLKKCTNHKRVRQYSYYLHLACYRKTTFHLEKELHFSINPHSH